MKKVTLFEKMFLDLNERVQLALEVSSPEIIPKIVRNLKNHLLGFHYKLEGSNIIYHNNPIPNYAIPSSVKSAREACNYINSKQYDVKDTFTAIGYNDKYVAVSAHHMLCDGGLMMEAFENLHVDEPCKLSTNIPMNVADMFPTELKGITDADTNACNYSMDKITKLRWSKNYPELSKIPGIETKCIHIEIIGQINIRLSKIEVLNRTFVVNV